jgi:hypothetical protein
MHSFNTNAPTSITKLSITRRQCRWMHGTAYFMLIKDKWRSENNTKIILKEREHRLASSVS